MKRSIAIPAMALLSLLVLYSVVGSESRGVYDSINRPLDALGSPIDLPPAGLLDSSAALGFLLLGAYLAGRIAAGIGLPRLTGYLLFGLLCGPSLAASLGRPDFALVKPDQLSYLQFVDTLAISIIGFLAGGALPKELLRNHLRGLLGLLGLVALAVGGACVAAAWWLLPAVSPTIAAQPPLERLFICVCLGALMVSTSPAVTTALVKECRSRGALSDLALGATICGDLLLTGVATMLIAIGAANFSDPGTQAEHALGAAVAWRLIGSIGVGVAVAPILRALSRLISRGPEALVLASTTLLAIVSDALGLSPLLTALAASATMSNLYARDCERFFATLDRIALPVYCIFFAAVGTRLHLEQLSQLWRAALVLAVLRMAATWAGVTAGTPMVAIEGTTRRWAWTAFVPQAGVSLALAAELRDGHSESEWSPILWALIVAVVAINETIGPPLMRLGLARSGEFRP